MSVPRYAYIISRRLDPIFALSIGVTAAILRVRREEKEKGISDQQTLKTLKRRVAIAWEGGVAKW